MKPKLALEASAGSGKTFALSVRYVALVLQGAHPSKIVALTFTKKAANEMKERVKGILEDLASKPAEWEALSALLECDKEAVLALQKRALPKFLNAALSIETIDAYVARILRKFSLHHGILPDFSIGAQPEMVALLEAFLIKVEKEGKQEALVKFAAALRLSRNDIFSLFGMLYEKESELAALTFPPTPYPSDHEVLEAAGALYAFLEKAKATPRSLSPFAPRTLRGLLEKNFWAKESLDYWDYKKLHTPELERAFEALKDAYGAYAKQREGFLLGELMALFEIYKQVRMGVAKERNELTFTDVTNSVYRLLHEGLERDFLYFRLDGMVEHLLIDEFQDTNVAQYEILAPLVEEIIAGVGVKEARSFFYVGDVKQSIYRFRGGSGALFYEAASRFDVPVEALRTNYRSKPEVVTFVNEVFENVLSHYTPQVTPSHVTGGMVQVIQTDEPLEGVIKQVGILLEKGVLDEEIAVLTQTNDDASAIKEALQEAYPTLHVNTHATLRLCDIPFVQALIACAKYSYFQAPLFWHETLALSQSEAKPRIFRFEGPLEIVFRQMVEYLGLDGSHLWIIAFLEAVGRYEDIEAFLFDLERFDAQAPMQESVGVKVLTVHKSKGLEFGYAVVCDRLKGENTHRDPLLFSYEGSRLTGISYVQKQREHVDASYGLAKTKEKERQKEDQLNAHYVALTRGRAGLVVVQKSQKSVFESLGLTPCARGEILPSSQSAHALFEPLQKPLKLHSLGPQAKEKSQEEKEDGVMEARLFGQALHEALEWMPAFEPSWVVPALLRLRGRYGALGEMAWKGLEKRIKGLVAHPEFVALVGEGVVHKEQPLMYQGEQKQVDVLVERDNKVIVIDYKSGRTGEEGHKKQVLAYKEAVASIVHKPVEAWLFYVGENQIEIISL